MFASKSLGINQEKFSALNADFSSLLFDVLGSTMLPYRSIKVRYPFKTPLSTDSVVHPISNSPRHAKYETKVKDINEKN